MVRYIIYALHPPPPLRPPSPLYIYKYMLMRTRSHTYIHTVMCTHVYAHMQNELYMHQLINTGSPSVFMKAMARLQ